MLIIIQKFNWYIFSKFLTLLLKCTLVATFNNKVVQFKLLNINAKLIDLLSVRFPVQCHVTCNIDKPPISPTSTNFQSLFQGSVDIAGFSHGLQSLKFEYRIEHLFLPTYCTWSDHESHILAKIHPKVRTLYIRL